MHIPVYAIRHKPTDRYIPNVVGQRARRGSSLLEPIALDPEDPKTHPRIFPSRGSANSFLNQWVKGEHMLDDYDPNSGNDKIKIVPVASRKREEMEIKPLFIEVPI